MLVYSSLLWWSVNAMDFSFRLFNQRFVNGNALNWVQINAFIHCVLKSSIKILGIRRFFSETDLMLQSGGWLKSTHNHSLVYLIFEYDRLLSSFPARIWRLASSYQPPLSAGLRHFLHLQHVVAATHNYAASAESSTRHWPWAQFIRNFLQVG